MSTASPFPGSIATDRLILRTWSRDEAAQLKAVIDANLAHLQAWMAWAMREPQPLETVTSRVAAFAREFEAGNSVVYAVRDRRTQAVLGGAGMEFRDVDCLEVGYWLARDQTGQGYATEAVHALTAAAFRLPVVQRVEIRCDPQHAASAAVARRAGYVHVTTVPHDTVTPAGAPRDSMVWETTRARFYRVAT